MSTQIRPKRNASIWKSASDGLLNWVHGHPTALRSLVWFALAVVAFVAVAGLTRHIASVTRALDAARGPGTILNDNSAWYIFTVLAKPGVAGPAFASYDYTDMDKTVVLTFVPPPGTEQVRVWPLTDPSACHYMAPGLGPQGRVIKATQEDTGNSIIDVSDLTFDDTHTLVCDLLPHTMRETFTTRVSAFSNYANVHVANGQGQELVPLPARLSVTSRDGGFEIATEQSPGENGIAIQPGHFVVVRFHSVRQQELRDWYLIMIGVVTAFGAGFVLEGVRPYIERIGHL